MGKKPAKGEHAEPQPRTLCWCCRRSFLNGCSWAESGIPVDGWDAIEDTREWDWNGTPHLFKTYYVLKCPLFKDDCPEGSFKRTYHAKPIEDENGAQLLAAEMIKQACKDYLEYYRIYLRQRDETALNVTKSIENWIRSKHFTLISEIDPDWLIAQLKKRARMLALKKVREKKK